MPYPIIDSLGNRISREWRIARRRHDQRAGILVKPVVILKEFMQSWRFLDFKSSALQEAKEYLVGEGSKMIRQLFTLLLLTFLEAGFEILGGVSRERSLMIVVVLPLLAWILWTIFRFARADGDLSILSKSAPPIDAFKDKVVWITGASQGFGEQLALEFARLGAKLILSSRRLSELKRVQANLPGQHVPHDVVVLPLDVSAGEEIMNEAVEKAESAFSGNGVDIMVHNAAYPRPKLGILDISEQETKASFGVNVLGTITLTRLLAPKMVSRGHGHFVVLSSAAGKISAPGQSVYSATKFAVQGYFGALRNEIGSEGIKVTLICPGPIATDSTQKERQPLRRCADLTMRAVYHEVEEAWIMLQPVLAMCYLQQYCPSISSKVLQKLGPKRVKQGNTYSLSKLLKKD